MSTPPVSPEVAAALARFFHGGSGPSHSSLSSAFAAGGYGDADPYIPTEGVPNKETRVLTVLNAASRRPATARAAVEALLVPLRVDGFFRRDDFTERVGSLRRALARVGWALDDDGLLTPLAGIDLTTGGREALDEQIGRLRRSVDDPGALLGSAKDLLESTAKFVLEEVGMPASKRADFNELWYLSRERLGLLPQQVNPELPGHKSIQRILQASWAIAEQVSELRGLQGAGHGRTLPTGVSAELALLVVRESCSVAEYMLQTLDRQYGRS